MAIIEGLPEGQDGGLDIRILAVLFKAVIDCNTSLLIQEHTVETSSTQDKSALLNSLKRQFSDCRGQEISQLIDISACATSCKSTAMCMEFQTGKYSLVHLRLLELCSSIQYLPIGNYI